MKTLYAVMTNACNLSCPHCKIKDDEIPYHPDKFLYELNHFDGHIILFGGEPTVNRPRMMSIIQENREHGISKIGSISTNLVILDEELISLYKEIGYIATSWNRTRFTQEQYRQWIDHIKQLGQAGVKPGIIITVTNDLMNQHIDWFLNTVDEWPSEYISWIRFEHLIDSMNRLDYYHAVDTWLSFIYQKWRSPIRVETFDKNLKWYHDCSEVYTLEPDGMVYHGCPNGLFNPKQVLTQCLACTGADKCRPCQLHKYCSYPFRLRLMIEGAKNE